MIETAKRFSMDWFRLDGKVAMITGANQGLGMGYAIALAKAGADIFIPFDSAFIRHQFSGNNIKKSRLSFSIGTDKTDVFPF